jgi:hypothetical protein
MKLLRDGLSSRNGFVRKGTRALLAIPHRIASLRASEEDFAARPPVLANSFPKSGTHLLAQIVEGLPDRTNYGAFLGSETSSFQLRERSADNTCRFIRNFVPGEIIRGHLYYDPLYANELICRRVVNCFIYRDPRDVVVSEARYLRDMNRWHRLHPYFRRMPSIADAIMLSITGFEPPIAGIYYPNIAVRFARYHGWLSDENCFAVRYEDVISERRSELIKQIAEFYARQTQLPCDIEVCAAAMEKCVAPQKSHTFRSGKRAGWRHEFNADHRQRFAEIAGDLLIELGYESNYEWVSTPLTTDAASAAGHQLDRN